MKVRRTACPTCIYRADSPLDLAELEAEVRDPSGHYRSWRACHHHMEDDVCCRGFWLRHRRDCTPCQLSERLGLVVEVDDAGGRARG